MRAGGFIGALLIAVALAGCTGMPVPPVTPVAEGPPPADLDSIMYSRGAPVAPEAVAVLPAGPPPIVAPVGPPLPPPIPAAVLPGPAPGGDLPYTLDSGDRLRIVVFGQDGLSNTYIVDVAGKIAMPLIGAVSARGCTTTQLARVIADKLRNGFVREPHVAVEVELYRPFFILGEVTLPGQYPYVPNMTVETAVAIAGGYTPRAFKRRIEVSHQVNGLTETRVVSPNYPVRPGDTVHIAERWF